ncbi:MAG: HAMP domain-containing sensor histidine kinase [Lachnospiraceae bacterium]|nr:HAMP domain-containing sensor histidine kinase [Lachnospiraceae bacterium]
MKETRFKKIPPINKRLFLLELLIIFTTIVILMTAQAALYGVDILNNSSGYVGWYLLYWGIAVFAAVLLITFLRYCFIDYPVQELSRAAQKVAAGDFTTRLPPYAVSGKKGYINTMYHDFNKMVEELASTKILKDDFVANVSHEIKTPLAVIQNYVTLLQDRAFVLADESMVEIIWNNLLSNAIKFTETGGKIVLKQYAKEGFVWVVISDTGCGMDKQTLYHSFDKFYQGDTSHSREGYGLGLALTARIIDLNNGEINVTSSPGKGSTFTVHLQQP